MDWVSDIAESFFPQLDEIVENAEIERRFGIGIEKRAIEIEANEDFRVGGKNGFHGMRKNRIENLPVLCIIASMKSAYELAMERLEKDGTPPLMLSDAQKKEIADIDTRFKAKIAGKEVFLGGLIAKAQAEGNFEEITELEEQKAREISRLRRQCESEKEKIRKAAGSQS